MNKKYKKVLIINTFGIGDVLFATPLVRGIKKNMPDAQIDFMCNARTRDILKNNKNINELIVFEKDDFRIAFKKSKIGFIKKIIAFVAKVKSKKYDMAIDLSLGYQISLALMLLGIRKRIGLNFRNRGRFLTDKLGIEGFTDKHVVEYYLDVLTLIGITNYADKRLEIEPAPEFGRWADYFLRENGLEGKILVGFAPGGGKSWGEEAMYRRWAPENFRYIAEELLKKRDDLFFVIFGASEERGLCCAIESGIKGKALNLCGRLLLPQSIALIKRCAVMLCNEGGILHIATSQDVKTVSIFGPVNDKVYGPYPPSLNNKVVTADNVKCRPCYKNFRHTMCETRDCLKYIDRDRVLKLIKESLGI